MKQTRQLGHTAALTKCAALLTLLAACGSNAAELRVPNSGFVGVGQDNARLDRPYTGGAMNVCTTGTTPVDITKVEPVRPSGPIRFVDWGVRLSDATHTYPTGYVGLVREKVTAEGFGHGPVTVRCSTPARVAMDQFAFEVELTGPGIGAVRGMRIIYGGARSVVMPYGVVLCQHKCPRNIKNWVFARGG